MPILQPMPAGSTYYGAGGQYARSHGNVLPANQPDVTPESYLNEQVRTGRQQIQDKYGLQWDEVVRSKRFLGAGKTKRMLREIDSRAKQEMLAFNQQAQEQMAQIQNVDRLAEQGMIYNADKVKARMVFGSDVAKSMYPETETIEQRYGSMDIHLNRIESRLAQFRDIKGGKEPEPAPLYYGALGPFIGTAALARHAVKARKAKEKGRPTEEQILDLSLTSEIKDPKTGEILIETGNWRPVTQEEAAERKMLKQERKRIKLLQSKILGQPDIQRRIVQPGTIGGTYSDKIAESMGKPKSDPLGIFSK